MTTMTSHGITSSTLPCMLYDIDRMKARPKQTLDIDMGDSNTFRLGDKGHRVRFKEPMKSREKLLRYPGVDDILNSGGVRKEPLVPYEDSEVRVNPDIYMQRGERKNDVDEGLLDSYIGRVCLAAAMDEKDGYGISKSKRLTMIFQKQVYSIKGFFLISCRFMSLHLVFPLSPVQSLLCRYYWYFPLFRYCRYIRLFSYPGAFFRNKKIQDKKGKKWNKKEKKRKMAEEYIATEISDQSSGQIMVIPLREFR
ncbi:uncharacterized protein [Argopecten irradians]|uniref:uncharacterized protein n=1 Tax=Argopecten irradians TaxID=31199 RepID=UPI0037168E82